MRIVKITISELHKLKSLQIIFNLKFVYYLEVSTDKLVSL